MSGWRAFFLAVAAVGLLGRRLAAEEAKPLAPFDPPVNATNTLRLGGNRHMADLARAWAKAYQARHPEIHFELNMLGNGIAMPALYLGLADIVFFGRDLIVTDRDGFNHVRKYDPLRIEIGTGSLATAGRAPALVVFVHRDNPLGRLTLEQVDAIFSSQRRRGAPAAIRTWGELGLTGEWASQPIHLYADDTQSHAALFFQRVVLGQSRQMNWDHFTEFVDRRQSDGTVVEAVQQAAAALEHDRFGLAISTLAYASPRLKPVPLAVRPGAPDVLASLESVRTREYPLARPIFACVDQRPGQPLDPKVRDFLRFVLGPEGQALMASAGGLIPLPADAVQAELSRLP